MHYLQGIKHVHKSMPTNTGITDRAGASKIWDFNTNSYLNLNKFVHLKELKNTDATGTGKRKLKSFYPCITSILRCKRLLITEKEKTEHIKMNIKKLQKHE